MIKQKLIWAMIHILTSAMISITMAPSAIAAPESEKTTELEIRLAQLSSRLEEKRIEHHIPGMAIAVVQDDKVIFARGFGVSDLVTKKPVTKDTLFGIGSTTKAFTSTLIGMLVDDGKMEWDDAITKYISYMKFPLNNPDDYVTIRDMLSHRTGYSRNDILWANGAVSRADILRNAIKAKSSSGFRKAYNYNNVMFLGAGVASAKASGGDWDNLLEQRILKPLGMENTNSRYEDAQGSSNLSSGYVWHEETQEYQQLPMRNINNVAPAGAINSTIMDMSKWLRFQLAGGTFEGKQLISRSQLLEARKPQIKVSSGVDYGLGWFLREWQGQPVIEHGGSINGFAAEVALLPESDLGFVLLTNVTSTPLQQESMNIIWSSLLGEDAPQKSSEYYEEFVGEYIANFGPFKDATFTFLVKDGVPALDVPGQTVYELKDQDASGKWKFAITDTIAISFDRGADGKVKTLRMHQEGMNFELPRKGVPVVAEIDPAKFQKYLGSYQTNIFDGNVEAIIQNGRLALDIPNKMVIELHLPGEDGRRQARIRPQMKVDFDINEKGTVTALHLYRNGKKMDTAPRVIEKSREMPTVQDILILRQTESRKAALMKSGGFKLSGKIAMLQAGISGEITSTFLGSDFYRVDINLGKYGTIHTAYNGKTGASMGLQPYTEYKDKYLEQIKKDHPAVDIDWRDFYVNTEVTKVRKIEGRDIYILKLRGGKTPPVTLHIDAATGDILKRKTRLLVPGIDGVKVTVLYEDYREVHGLRLPFKITSSNKLNGTTVMKYDTIEASLELDPDLFVLKE